MIAVNTTVTAVSCTRLNAHVVPVVPAQGPDQPWTVAPAFGVAVTVICVPETNVVPIGDCVTVPGPSTPTLSVNAAANSAVADTFDEMLKVQTGFVFPAHGPLNHCWNPFPAAGTAVRVIDVFGANEVPAGDCVIDPNAGGKTVVTRVYWPGLVNVAVSVVLEFSVATHMVGTGPTRQAPAGVKLTNC